MNTFTGFQKVVVLFFLLSAHQLSALETETEYELTLGKISSLIEDGKYEQSLRKTEIALSELRNLDSLYLFLDLAKSVGTQLRKAGFPKLAETIFSQARPENLWRKPSSEREESKAAWLYVQLAYNYYIELGDYTKARNAYELSLNSLPNSESESYNAAKFIRKALGNIYTRLGEYSASETMLKKYIAVMIANVDYEKAALGYNDLGLLYNNWEKTKLAKDAYETGLSLPNNSNGTIAMLSLNLLDLLIRQDSLEIAETRLNDTHRLLEEELTVKKSHYRINLFLSGLYQKQALIHSERKDYNKALTALNQEFDYLKKYYKTTNRREFGKHYVQKGLLYLEMQNRTRALAQFQLALQSVLYGYSPEGLHALPSPTACYAENTIMEALDGMGQVYQQWYKTEPKSFYLEQALASYELIHVVEQALRQSYLYDSSKLFNLEESRQQSENAIRVAHQLYQQNQDKNLLYRAFVFAERNRSSLLREAFRANRAAVQAGITGEELAEESRLQRTVSQAEEELFRLRSEAASTDSLIRAAEEELLAAQDAIRNWLQALEERNPRYYQLKYADEVPTLTELQSMLARHEQLIEYFVGEEKIYVFKIDRQGLSLHELPKPQRLTERILAWRAAIENYQLSGNDREQLVSDYLREGYLLYQELVAPIITGTTGKSLLLVTSGMLDLLPFEALLTQKVATGTSFNDYPYLLRDFPISYTYAAGLQWSLYQLERHQGEKGGFAPTFTGQSGWPALSCSTDLLKTTVDNAANLYLADDATIKQLQTQASRFRLLHLATHAQANADEGNFSFIVFSDGQDGYDSLFAKDLYLYELETELVILSACETALGTLYNSEGVISLARAFHYAGARSVMNTLWRINENANCNLLEGFYTALDDGQDKRSALQNAKLTYLKNADPRSAHPVYWAGFQLLGNPRPLEAGTPWYLWVVGGLVIVGLAKLLLLGLGRRFSNAR